MDYNNNTTRKKKGKKQVTFRNNLRKNYNIPMNNINVELRKPHRESRPRNDFNMLNAEEKAIVRNAYKNKKLPKEILNRMKAYIDYLNTIEHGRAHLKNYEKNFLNTMV